MLQSPGATHGKARVSHRSVDDESQEKVDVGDIYETCVQSGIWHLLSAALGPSKGYRC